MKLHHVQVTCAPGREHLARQFYGQGLGLTEVEKPDALKPLGGAWFRSYGDAGEVEVEIHVGLEDPLTPARKAHPALEYPTVEELEHAAERLRRLGFDVNWSDRHTYPGHERFHTHDAEANRVELMAPSSRTS